jgi:hypothetical protein
MRSIIDATYVRPAWSSRLCERAQHLLLVGDQFSHAWPVLHPLEMRQTILELGKIEVELGAAPKAPEKVGIDGGILEAGLIADDRGALYGTAKFGGNVNPQGPCGVDGCGVVFRLTGTGFATEDDD